MHAGRPGWVSDALVLSQVAVFLAVAAFVAPSGAYWASAVGWRIGVLATMRAACIVATSGAAAPRTKFNGKGYWLNLGNHDLVFSGHTSTSISLAFATASAVLDASTATTGVGVGIAVAAVLSFLPGPATAVWTIISGDHNSVDVLLSVYLATMMWLLPYELPF